MPEKATTKIVLSLFILIMALGCKKVEKSQDDDLLHGKIEITFLLQFIRNFLDFNYILLNFEAITITRNSIMSY